MEKTLFNSLWYFTKSHVSIKNINLQEFTEITLPHTWNNIDGQDGGNDYFRGKCTYYKVFNHQIDDELVYIEFEGSNSITTIYLNGQMVGFHEGGYSLFRFDITTLLVNGQNELIVFVDNTMHPSVYPLAADFTFYGGIYRDVYLLKVPTTHITLNDFGSSGVYVKQEHITKECAELYVDVGIESIDIEHPYQLHISVLDMSSQIIFKKSLQFIPQKENNLNIRVFIENPHLWQGIDDPYLYQLNVVLQDSQKKIDSRIIPLGLRTFKLENQTFLLNDKPIKLNGVSRHQDYEKYGNALTKEMHEKDISLIKDIGANAVRLAHYQQANYIYELCDKEGLLVWAEIPYISISSSVDFEGKNACLQLEELIKQNYNHPSIFTWGIANEITFTGKKNNVENVLNKLHNIAKSLDKTRLTSIAHENNQAIDDSLVQISDLIAYNLYFGWYSGKVEDFSEWLSEFRKFYPSKPICISEYGVEGAYEYHSENPRVKDYSEEYHALWHEKAYKILQQTPFVIGSFVWNMFAFGSDLRNEGGYKGVNNKGLISFDRNIKKDAFFFYQATWSKIPMIHLCSKRFVNRNQNHILIKVYSNQPYVELFINQKPYGFMQKDGVIFTHMISLENDETTVLVSTDLLNDQITFKKGNINQSYIHQLDDKDNDMIKLNIPHNWFDGILESEKPIIVDSNFYSVSDKLGVLYHNEMTKEIISKILPNIANNSMFVMIENMSVTQLRRLSIHSFPYGAYFKLNEELQKIQKN